MVDHHLQPRAPLASLLPLAVQSPALHVQEREKEEEGDKPQTRAQESTSTTGGRPAALLPQKSTFYIKLPLIRDDPAGTTAPQQGEREREQAGAKPTPRGASARAPAGVETARRAAYPSETSSILIPPAWRRQRWLARGGEGRGRREAHLLVLVGVLLVELLGPVLVAQELGVQLH